MRASADRGLGTGTLVVTSGLTQAVFSLLQFGLYFTVASFSAGLGRRAFILRLCNEGGNFGSDFIQTILIRFFTVFLNLKVNRKNVTSSS